jgi:competence protein ComEC
MSRPGVPPTRGPKAREHWFPLAQRPLLVLCLLFLLGVWIDSRWAVPLSLGVGLGLVGALLGAMGRSSRAAAVGFGLGAVCCGALLHHLQTLPRKDDITLLAQPGQQAVIEGYVSAELPPRLETRQLLVQLDTLERDGHRETASGGVLVRVRGVGELLDGLRVRCEGTVTLPRPAGNPGEFDFAAVLARRQASAILNATSLTRSDDSGPAPWRHVQRLAAVWRRGIVGRLRASMPGPAAAYYASLLAGIVYGVEVTPVPRPVAESFRRTGTIHLLVVSGAQLTLLAAVVLFLCHARRAAIWRGLGARLRGGRQPPSRIVPRMRWWEAVLAACALAFFALMVGTGPSVSRALAMAVLAFSAGVCDHDYDSYTALGLAAAAICAIDPHALFSIGAQLSFAAALGVIVALRSLPDSVKQSAWPTRLLIGAGAAALGSWLMVTPLLAYHFGAFPLTGAVANVAAVPLCAVAMVITFIAIPLSWVSEAVAAIPLYPARWLVSSMVGVNGVCENLPAAYRQSSHFSVLWCVAWYGLLALVACAYRARYSWREWLTPKRIAGSALAAALAASLWFAISSNRPGRLEVTFLDVGHGQCCVIRSPSGRSMMVDAGSGYRLAEGERCARDVIVPFLASRGIKRIDVAVITHPDADHCDAVGGVLAEVPVGMVLESFAAPDSAIYAHLSAIAAQRGVPFKRAAAGGRLDLGGGVRAEVLWPTGTPSDETFTDNDRSIVLRLTHGKVSMLLTGDIEAEAESELLRRNVRLSADVLQVPHHGGRHSSSPAFLQAVAPTVAVVSCQSGDADHPHATVQARLRDVGAQLWRTDLDGAITILSDGEGVVVHAFTDRRRAQNRSRVWEHAWASASSSRSGSRSASWVASGVSLGRMASTMRRPISARTSGASSNLRSRKRSMAPRSSGATLPASGRSATTQSSVG